MKNEKNRSRRHFRIGNWVWFVLFSVGMTGLRTQVLAIPDQGADDMLSSRLEDQNDDAVVRWGRERRETRPLTALPISENSLNGGASRAPASAVEEGPVLLDTGNRTPAGQALIRTLAEKKAYQEVAVIVNDQGFFPSTVFVTQGIPVRLYVTGASTRSQCFMMDQFQIRRQIQNQKIEEISFTAEEPGVFTFGCPMNGAKGTLLVRELDADRLPASFRKAE